MIETFNRDTLGKIVRSAWIDWCKSQPADRIKPGWLDPYEEMQEPDKEADRIIGERVARFVIQQLKESLAIARIAQETNSTEEQVREKLAAIAAYPSPTIPWYKRVIIFLLARFVN